MIMVRRMLKEARGASAVEYGLIAALIALPAALALSGLSEELQNVLFEIANAVKM